MSNIFDRTISTDDKNNDMDASDKFDNDTAAIFYDTQNHIFRKKSASKKKTVQTNVDIKILQIFKI